MLGTEPSDPVVARLLADVPVLMSGIRQIKGRLYLYLGIDRAYFNRHGGEPIYHTLTKRFPTVPFYIEPSDGVQLLSATRAVQEVVPAGKAADDDCALCDFFDAFNDMAEEKADEEADEETDEPAEPTEYPDVMGGDQIIVMFDVNNDYDPRAGDSGSGTLTLGGLTIADGTKGLVTSGHVAVRNPNLSLEGYRTDKNETITRTYGEPRWVWQFLGKVMRTPRPRRARGFDDFFYADAAFVAYPSAAADDCSLTTETFWSNIAKTHEPYCFDLGKGEPIETVKPLAIRGKNKAVYTVIGSQFPTMGLEVMFSGITSGVVEGNRVTSGAILTRFAEDGGVFYTYDINGGGESTSGDSGSPIYTVPDRNGNVHIIGILRGGGTVAGEKITTFSSWDDVDKELDLQPISP